MIENKLQPLIRLGPSEDDLLKFDVLCLPENIDSQSADCPLYDVDACLTACKLLKAAHIRCANSLDLGLKAKFLERRGDFVWLGSIWILNQLVIPAVIGTLSSLLAARIARRHGNEMTAPPKSPTVRVNLLVRKDGEFCSLRYEGDAKTLLRVLNTIQSDKDGD